MKKPQLVLLHGLFGSPAGLAGVAEDLRGAGYEVFAPAVPPFAGSEGKWAELQSAMIGGADSGAQRGPMAKWRRLAPDGADLGKVYAEYFREYFAQNEIVEPVLIGHSMGTLVASSILQYHPEIVNEKVVFMSPISRNPSRLIADVSVLSAYVSPKVTDWVTTQYLIVPRNHKFFRETLAMVNQCSHDQRPGRKYIKEATKFSTGPTIVDKLSQTLTDKHFQIYLLAGEHDRLISQKATRRAAEKLEGLAGVTFECEYDFLPGTGHLHNYEKPHETTQRIIRFLEK